MDTLEKLVDGIIAAWNNHDPVEFAAQFSEDGVLRIVATGRSCAAARSSVQTLRPFFGGSQTCGWSRRAGTTAAMRSASSSGR